MEDALAAYTALVLEWAPRLDLVAPGDLSRLRRRHIDDSLRAASIVAAAPPGPAIDVGSGAGFPGIPLAIAGPRRRWRLLEPRRRRAAFLEEVVRALELDCEVVNRTAEQIAEDAAFVRAHVVATARALAPPLEAKKKLVPLLAAGGRGIVWTRANFPGSRDGLLIFDRDD